MKNMSAKFKLTLLNSLFMFIMAVIVVGLLLVFGEQIADTNSKSLLQKVVGENAGELDYDDGKLDIGDITFYEEGVHTLIYTQEGVLAYGTFPENISAEVNLKNNALSEIDIEGTHYYIFDLLSPVEDYPENLWVRGIIAVEESVSAANTVLHIALFALPFFIVLGTIGCYFIVRLTLRPLEQIVKTAEDISKSEDLSLRINPDSSSEEIYNLASTFDHMLERLEGAFEAERHFSQNVSHELRTPTAVILAQCEFALSESSSDEDKQEALEVIERQAGRMARMISELLSLVRLERGIEKPAFDYINFSELVELACEDEECVNEKGITLNSDIAQGIVVYANQTMLIRLVANLLSNAYRYGKEGGEIWVKLSETQGEAVLCVQDNGIGISPEHKDKIWQRFYQVDKVRGADRSGSMGLGLSMVWQIAKIHRAYISVDSEPGKGSSFTIVFPKNSIY